MFERFAVSAREVVHEAQLEARRLNADAVGPEHLLIALAGRGGLLREPPQPLVPPETVIAAGPSVQMWPQPRVTADELRAALAESDADALAAIGISLPEVQRAVEQAFGPDALAAGEDRLPFRKEAKRALELSLREALSLGLRRIDPQVLLLGVLREPNSATQLLTRIGVDPEQMYQWRRGSLQHLADAPR